MNYSALLTRSRTTGSHRLRFARRAAVVALLCVCVSGCGAAQRGPSHELAPTASATAVTGSTFNADQQIHEQDYCSCNK
jgi:hypothetical protein